MQTQRANFAFGGKHGKPYLQSYPFPLTLSIFAKHLVQHGRSYYEWLNGRLDSSAEDHQRKWGCMWNRDIVALVQQVQTMCCLMLLKLNLLSFSERVCVWPVAVQSRSRKLKFVAPGALWSDF
jgi:hypothetical protein